MTKADKAEMLRDLYMQKKVLEEDTLALKSQIDALTQQMGEGDFGCVKVAQVTTARVSWADLAKAEIKTRRLTEVMPQYSTVSSYYKVTVPVL